MGMIYTSLPLSDPTRQRYQSIIDNSSALVSKRRGRDGNRQSGNTVDTDWAKTLNNMYSNGINRYSPYGNTYSGWNAIENAFNRKQAAFSKDQASKRGKNRYPLSFETVRLWEAVEVIKMRQRIPYGEKQIIA